MRWGILKSNTIALLEGQLFNKQGFESHSLSLVTSLAPDWQPARQRRTCPRFGPAMQALRTHLDQLTRAAISDADFALVAAHLRPCRLRKGQFLLRAGDVCPRQAFVVTGALRRYTLNARGNRQIHSLSVENTWLGDWESGLHRTPSRYCIDALEHSQLLLIDCQQVQELVRRVPLVAELLRVKDERNAIADQKRLHEAIACPAEERYAAFLAQHPSYAQRFSQLTIASYLGMSPEALSRIRAKLLPARTPAFS